MYYTHFDYRDGERPESETHVEYPARDEDLDEKRRRREMLHCSVCGDSIEPGTEIDDGAGGVWCVSCVPF